MKVVILAGGFGTRLSEETELKPKPMVEIGGMPILWHIMKIYDAYGFNEFIICCGYKGQAIKEYFINYSKYSSDFTIDLSNDNLYIHKQKSEKWKVTLVDTGLNSMTGGRIKKIKDYIGDQTFMLTYGDGLCDVNINDLLVEHKKNKCLATVTAVKPIGRFGALDVDDDDKVNEFLEKPACEGAWINGGFFVLEPNAIDYIKGDDTVWEKEPLQKLAKDGQLFAYKHRGFWKPMDMLKDKNELEEIWNNGGAPWAIWK